jgi:DNA-binding NarL/FixJ family response regulator
MPSALKENRAARTAPWGELPPEMRVLFVTGERRTGSWLAEAFAADSASKVRLEEAPGATAAMARLRDDAFDAVLISHGADDLDALEFLDALRAGSSEEQPVVVLGAQSEQEMAPLCYEAGADAYVCVHASTTRALLWQVARAIERHRLHAENRRLQQACRQRIEQEQDEAARLLAQQRGLIAEGTNAPPRDPPAGDAPHRAAADSTPPFPESLVAHYRELLRAYVVMGSGNLAADMDTLSDLLATVGLSARQAMLLHLNVLEEMVAGLGSRSARHVMNRADLLILEVMMNLAENYRRRHGERLHPPRQLPLPGFDADCPAGQTA